jgi:uncharacterized protein YjbI with pentapeptide repeats
MDGHVISGRTIPGAMVKSALYGEIDSPRPAKSLWIEDSTITGDIVTPPSQGRPTSSLPLKIIHSLVQGTIDLKTTDFNGDIDLSKTTFEGQVFFDNASFEGKVIVQGAVFRQTTMFVFETTFDQGASFSSSQFEDYAGFVEASFEKLATFKRAQFKSTADFSGADFSNGVSFYNSRFEEDARFDRVVIGHMSASYGPFHNTDFLKAANFRRAKILGPMAWINTSFQGEAYFENLSTQSRLNFSGAKFRSLANFSGMKAKEVTFKGEPSYFEKAALFRDLSCQKAEFTGTEFHELVDFSGSTFSDLSLADTRFMGDVDLQGTKFNAGAAQPPLKLKRVRFDKALNLDWDQFVQPGRSCFFCAPPLRLGVDSPTTWEAMVKAFEKTGNLTAKNESLYQEAVMKRDEDDKPPYLSLLQDRFWGYGTRPSRVLFWMALVVLLFAAIYRTQTRALWGRSPWATFWARWSFALRFSLRTSWSLDYGRTNSVTTLFKVLTSCQSLGFKLLLFFFIKALANVSPLLNEIVGKLLPA